MTAAGRRYGGVGAAIVAVALVALALWPAEGAQKLAALVGLVLSVGSSALSVAFKGMARTLNGALLVVVLTFGFRAVLATLGALWAIRWGGGVIPFVLGFFGTFLPLQWVEIGFLLAQAKGEALKGR